MSQQNTIRLTPETTEFLNTQPFSSGEIYFNREKNTLNVMDGVAKGGYELLRSDLSNIAGGGGGSGTINFGSRTITAQAFVGDGSALTNLPIPTNLVTQTDLDNRVKVGVAGQLAYYDTTGSIDNTGTNLVWNNTDGKMTIKDLEVTGILLASIQLDGFTLPDENGDPLTAENFTNDITLATNSQIAIPTEFAVKGYVDAAVSGIDTSASGIVDTGTAGQFAIYFENGKKVVGTGTYITYDFVTDTISAVNINLSGDISAVTVDSTTLNATDVNTTNVIAVDVTTDTLTVNTDATITNDLTVSGSLKTTEIINIITGVPRFQSGTDFIIDAVGDVNVSGSKIRNLATPLISTDAATKAYVDGAASAFSGGTVAGITNFTNTTGSTGVDVGAVTIDGGLGVNGDAYFGGLIYSGGSPVLTSSSGGFNGGIISGALFVNNNTPSTTTGTGALRVTGGVGIVGNLNVGPDITVNGIKFGRSQAVGVGSNTNISAGGGAGNDAPLALVDTGTSNTAYGYNTLSAITNATNNTAIGRGAMGAFSTGSNSVALGYYALRAGLAGNYQIALGPHALETGGGDNNIGIGFESLKLVNGIGNIGLGFASGNAILLGNYNVIIGSNTGSTITGSDNNVIISDGQGNIRAQWDSFGELTHPGNLYVSSTTTSTLPTDGALIVDGGTGIGGALNVAGVVKITSTAVASNVSSGALIVSGGIGVNGTVHASSFVGDGSNLSNITASSFSGGTVSGVTIFSSATPATSTITGAVRISAGGLGVSGAVWAGNFNGASIPSAGSVPGANGLVRTDGSGYAYVNYINSNTAAETLTLGNFIVTNNSDNFYRKYTLANVKTGLHATRNSQAGSQTTTLLTATASLGGIEMLATDSATAAAFMSFHRPNRHASYFGLDTDNQFAVGGWSAGAALTSMKVGSFGVGTAASGTAGEIRATNNVTAFYSSDIKFKENVRDIPNALDTVVAIGGKLFSWTDAYLKEHGGQDDYFLRKDDFGVIAQDVLKVFPQAVRTRTDGSLAVDYEKLSALAFAAIVQLTQRVEQLEKDR
jgi:hypothetical protein